MTETTANERDAGDLDAAPSQPESPDDREPTSDAEPTIAQRTEADPAAASTGEDAPATSARGSDPTVAEPASAGPLSPAAPGLPEADPEPPGTQPAPEPAPAPVAPAPAGLRVADADREAVALALRDAAAEGRLSPDELAEREAAAYAAVIAPDLFALVVDLPVARELAASQLAPYGLRADQISPAAAAQVTSAAGVVTGTGSSSQSVTTTLWSVLSEVKRKGSWVVPERLSVNLALGETRLDMREATLSAPVTTIDILGTLGEVKVIVPDSWRIECAGAGILGSYQVKDVDDAVPPAPNAPLLRFGGAMVLGEVTIYRTNAPAGEGSFSIDGVKGVRSRRQRARERRRTRHDHHHHQGGRWVS